MRNKKYSPWMSLAVRLIPAMITETAALMAAALVLMTLGEI